jgi:hypothetical protein
MPLYNPPPSDWGNPQAMAEHRRRAAEIIRSRGSGQRPFPPRSVTTQPGSRKVLVTFAVDPGNPDTTKHRVYKDTESRLFVELAAGVNQCEVSASTSATPSPINVFVSAVNRAGLESRKVLTQCAPAAEAAGSAPPPDAEPPAGWTSEPSGGGRTGGSGRVGRVLLE